MSYHQTGSAGAGHAVCQYGESRLWFRGPERSLDTVYMVCTGGDETYGRFVERPFATILEEKLDRRCLNLGSLFCGVEALCSDAGLFRLLNMAELCILQAPGVLSQTNHFYRVHPRRNDRVLTPTSDLIDLYPELDFTDVHFVHHLMSSLQRHQDARFEVVVDELRRNWVRKISDLLHRLEVPVILLGLRVLQHKDGDRQNESTAITPEMFEAVRPLCADFIEVTVPVSGQSDALEDMLFGTLQQPMAEYMIGPAAHKTIADALLGPIRRQI
ncbi:DUF6473 family protein [Ruegeria profundi]|uniref:DUF6473 family protein n=1 Tax=Ruegeria profundi TaxID=1685378 RepID=UPI001CD3BCC2|nr:DUF6473 family protein [Ruegeria profundi]MCA0930291.1 DUF6473 family protein [Ruegeria profundi]